ncbi:MAG: hypothetical protein KBS61_01280, partial [Chryseobacterium sp.]|nr:hypothetical protein [Candidatus Chryseobacterium enterohippi]
MNLTKNQKILTGIFHFLPIVGIICFLFTFFSMFISIPNGVNDGEGGPFPAEFAQSFMIAFILVAVMSFVSLGILVFDIIHLTKSNKGDTKNKILIWILILLFSQGLGSIVYY